jgi:hypothetical protein
MCGKTNHESFFSKSGNKQSENHINFSSSVSGQAFSDRFNDALNNPQNRTTFTPK